MEINLTAEQSVLIRDAIENGRYDRPEDAVEDALALWEERERRRAEVLLAADEAEEAVARGEGILITPESMRQLSADIKQRGRARLQDQTP